MNSHYSARHFSARHLPRRSLALSALAFASLLMAAHAQAAETCTWNGSASSKLSLAANWTCTGAATVPGTGDSLVFPAGANTTALINDFLPIIPTFYDVSFAPGYALDGDDLNVSHLLTVAGSFMNAPAIAGSNSAQVQVNGGPGGQVTWFKGTLNNMQSITVGDGAAAADAGLNATSNTPPITVAAQGRLSMGTGTTASTLDVQAGGTLLISRPLPGAAQGSLIGSGTVNGATTFAAGSTLEYHALTSFDSGKLVAQNGLNLNGATLKIVVEDPANPDAIGLQRTLVGYGDASYLQGRFAGLPNSGALIQASNAPGVWYAISYGSASNAFIQITRAAAPVAPPGGGTAAIPALAPLGLGLMSALVAGVGMARRRKRGA